jgi:Cof subfamily protein (haloacid dehalogenase superfamily)
LKAYKLLVLDVDGTLVNRDGAVSAADRTALGKASDLDVCVSLSTGRVIQACLELIRELSLDGYHIFYDGALVANPATGEEVYAHPLSREVVKEAVAFARTSGTYLELYSTNHFFAERENWSDEIHRRFFRVEPTFTDFNGIWERERIIKAELVAHNTAEETKAADFRRHFGHSLHFSTARTPAFPDVNFINITDPGVSKGEALKALVARLGVRLEEVMAIGDGSNDIPLLEAAGLAVAMGNAPDEVKAVADYLTLDVDHSGVAAAIERFLL